MENPSDHIVLPEIVSKEPLGPLVRHGDDEWADVGRWVLNALVIAEEKCITSANIDSFSDTKDAEIHRLLGTGDDDMMAMVVVMMMLMLWRFIIMVIMSKVI